MAAIKALDQISSKWARVTPQRTQDYSQGVSNPRRPWAASAAAAQGVWGAAVQQAVTAGSFSKGVNKSGDANWQQKTLSKGPGRFAEGVAVGEGDFNAGFAPYHQVIAGLTLPPRGPKGSPQNLNRVTAIATALNKKRLGV
jgi:hypothetical protein